jgi:hypothetical protein
VGDRGAQHPGGVGGKSARRYLEPMKFAWR